MIRFTKDGVFADTEDERLTFYDRLTAGDPIIMAHLEIWRMELALDEMGDRFVPLEIGE